MNRTTLIAYWGLFWCFHLPAPTERRLSQNHFLDANNMQIKSTLTHLHSRRSLKKHTSKVKSGTRRLIFAFFGLSADAARGAFLSSDGGGRDDLAARRIIKWECFRKRRAREVIFGGSLLRMRVLWSERERASCLHKDSRPPLMQ